MFAQVTVERVEDPERLLVAGVKYRPGTPVTKTSSYLEAIWISELRLPGLDAFSFITDDGHVELEAFTGDKASGYFLTLHLLAEEGEPQDFETRVGVDPGPAGREPVESEPVSGKKSRWFRR